MFSIKKPSSVSSFKKIEEPIVKLIKSPISLDWIHAHYTVDGRSVSCFFVMEILDNNSYCLTFYYKKELRFKIVAPELLCLFDDIQAGWSRMATADDLEKMKTNSKLIKNVLSFGHVFSSGKESASAPVTPVNRAFDLNT